MKDINIAFCQLMLRSLRADCRKAKVILPKMKNCWTYEPMRGHWEFHAPDFYWHGSADNAFDARYKGLTEWIKQKQKAGYKRLENLYKGKKS